MMEKRKGGMDIWKDSKLREFYPICIEHKSWSDLIRVQLSFVAFADQNQVIQHGVDLVTSEVINLYKTVLLYRLQRHQFSSKGCSNSGPFLSFRRYINKGKEGSLGIYIFYNIRTGVVLVFVLSFVNIWVDRGSNESLLFASVMPSKREIGINCP